MLYTPHFLTGAVIMKLFPDPKIGLPLALLSHFILDLTPHNDFDLKPGITLREFFAFPKKRLYFILSVMGVDYLLTILSFLWILFHFQNYWLLVGGVVGVLPDLVEQFLMFFGVALPGWQDKLQWRVSAKYGFISYPIVSLISIYLLIH
ncbi:hypothetical protein A3D03_04310 [Candidatus Gottesmanbacteria bacterium RIFCSPHIGHO2_02_FULL_40_13]|uniref:Uncharacterized protein n=1 Tax=Candidatus Gottesmanbacteria bacterium RIFCSPHIGHO2_02_FULL_40_13 TaxID=1798384 RepID=A0A1F6A865_9BACT|nr:MAG: hypothetical protein A3D03_04310 [Candidatus Gottesmanbacteria bacterium RIFCSPHIGHO2_02_FULL_40_13]